jgi:hypothetical protein
MNIRRNYNPLQSSLRESKEPQPARGNSQQSDTSKQRIREHIIQLLERYEDRILNILREEYSLPDDEAGDYLAEAEEAFLQQVNPEA